MFERGKRLPNKCAQRLTDGGDIFKHLRIIHTICFIHLPLQIQRHGRDQQRRGFRLRLWRNGRIQVQIPFPLLLAQFLRIFDSAVFLRIFQVVFICTDLTQNLVVVRIHFKWITLCNRHFCELLRLCQNICVRLNQTKNTVLAKNFIQQEHLRIGLMPVGQLVRFLITYHTFYSRFQTAVKRLIFRWRDVQNLRCQCSKRKFFSVNTERFPSDIKCDGLKHSLLLWKPVRK